MNEQNEQKVYEQYEVIRREGRINMLDRIGVTILAEMRNFNELAEVAGNRDDYSELLVRYSELRAKYETNQEST